MQYSRLESCTLCHLRWVIGKIQEETHILHGAILLKVLLEKSGSFHVHLGGGGRYILR